MKDLTWHRKLSIAPMLDWTDRHDRYLLRLLSKEILLYSEMVTTGALIHGDRDHHLQFNQEETPVALQLGGSNPAELAECARMAEDYGYNEVNLNCGCPSDRVQSGRFGACLMAEPELVGRCVQAMQQAVSIPVTVKNRIGIDHMESFEEFRGFISTVADYGCEVFIVHARKAWLQGLSPKENREKPPLHYDFVYRIKEEFPGLHISLNGGVKTLDAVNEHLQKCDGVMVGREAYENPWMLARADEVVFKQSGNPVQSRRQVVEQFVPYVARQMEQGVPFHIMAKHILGLFSGMPGSRRWRRNISENQSVRSPGPRPLRAELLLECLPEG